MHCITKKHSYMNRVHLFYLKIKNLYKVSVREKSNFKNLILRTLFVDVCSNQQSKINRLTLTIN